MLRCSLMAKPAWPPPTTSVSTFSIDNSGSFSGIPRFSAGLTISLRDSLDCKNVISLSIGAWSQTGRLPVVAKRLDMTRGNSLIRRINSLLRRKNSSKYLGACQGQELQIDLPFPWHARCTVRGSPPIGLPRGRPYRDRPSGHRSGSPTSPPPPLIRPRRRLLRRSRRLLGPGPHIGWSISARAIPDARQHPMA